MPALRLALASVLVSGFAWGGTPCADLPPPADHHHHKIPLDAFPACKGKDIGADCHFCTKGKEITGQCQKVSSSSGDVACMVARSSKGK